MAEAAEDTATEPTHWNRTAYTVLLSCLNLGVDTRTCSHLDTWMIANLQVWICRTILVLAVCSLLLLEIS
jgi:hypothetical protein